MTFYEQEFNLFETKVIKVKDENFFSYRDDLIEWIENYKNSGVESVQKSNAGGWQSPSDFYLDKSFEPFMEKIWQHIQTTIKGYVEACPTLKNHLDDVEGRVTLLNAWINYNTTGNYNVLHVHPGSMLSAVLWVKIPEGSGNLVLKDPLEMNSVWFAPSTHKFEAEESAMLMFPAHIPHAVDENVSEDSRISIALNLG